MRRLSVAAHVALAAASVVAYALRPPAVLAITTLVPLLVGAGWVAAPYVSSLKEARSIRRRGAQAAHLAAAAAVFAAGGWVYATRLAHGPRGEPPAAGVLVYMLVPLLQAITLTVAGAAATAGERRPRESVALGRARDESHQKGR